MEVEKEREAYEALATELGMNFCRDDLGRYTNPVMNHGWFVWQQARAAAEGWVLVPREPTPEMADALVYLDRRTVRRGYAAMLSAGKAYSCKAPSLNPKD